MSYNKLYDRERGFTTMEDENISMKNEKWPLIAVIASGVLFGLWVLIPLFGDQDFQLDIILPSLALFVILLIKKKENRIWMVLPIALVLLFYWVVNVSFWYGDVSVWFLGRIKDVNYDIKYYYSSLGVSITVLACFGLISPWVFQILIFVKNRKIRSLAIASIIASIIATLIVDALMGITKGYIMEYHLIGSDAHIIGYNILMAIFIFLDFSLLSPNAKKVKVEQQRTVVSGAVSSFQLFCPSCGTRFPGGKRFCDQCGVALAQLAQPEPMVQAQTVSTQDAPSTGLALLGFFIPIAGFIMWVSWNNVMPLKAKSAGKGALIGLIMYVVLIVAYYVALYAWIASLLH